MPPFFLCPQAVKKMIRNKLEDVQALRLRFETYVVEKAARELEAEQEHLRAQERAREEEVTRERRCAHVEEPPHASHTQWS